MGDKKSNAKRVSPRLFVEKYLDWSAASRRFGNV